MLRVEVDSKVAVGIQLPLIESSSIAMYRSSIASNSLNSDQNDQVPVWSVTSTKDNDYRDSPNNLGQLQGNCSRLAATSNKQTEYMKPEPMKTYGSPDVGKHS